MKRNLLTQSHASVIFRQRLLKIGVTAVMMTGWLQAEPFVDELEDLSHISNDSGNCLFTPDNEGRLVVTKNEDPSNPFSASFGWNINKASREDGFSVDPTDNQHILVIKGITPVTDGNLQAKLYVVPFFGTATQSLGPLRGGDRAYFLPVEPDENGDWRVDISEVVETNFDENERPTWWFPQVIIDSDGDTDTGYRFDSLSAVGDEGQTE